MPIGNWDQAEADVVETCEALLRDAVVWADQRSAGRTLACNIAERAERVVRMTRDVGDAPRAVREQSRESATERADIVAGSRRRSGHTVIRRVAACLTIHAGRLLDAVEIRTEVAADGHGDVTLSAVRESLSQLVRERVADRPRYGMYAWGGSVPRRAASGNHRPDDSAALEAAAEQEAP